MGDPSIPDSMLAVVTDGDGRARMERRPVPSPGPGEALIRVRMAGICRTDVELVAGYMAYRGVLGHEFVGEVVSADEPGWVGRRVVGEINIPCGECDLCRRGLRKHCRRIRTLGIHGWDGTFAEYVRLPVANLHFVPDGVPDRAAVFTEPLAAALEILESVPVRPTDRVVVVGDGKLGLLCAQALAAVPCDLLAVGRHPHKLRILEESGIRTALATAASEDPDLAGRADVAVEATGRPGGLALAARLVRPRGTVVLKTTIHEPISLDLAPLVVREVRLVGSRCGPFQPALRLLAAGRIRTEPLISAVYPLAQGEQALARAAEPGMLKVLLEMGGS